VRIPWFSLVIVGVATLGGSGCSSLDHPYRCEASCAPDADRVVFVADGAGNYQMASVHLRSTVVENDVPLHVFTFDWSHGYGRVILDQISHAWGRQQGHRLAQTILDYHDEHPDMRIYLLGHSAGALVVLSAVEELPPGLVEGVVLLSPSLSKVYDLRTALANVAGTIDVFYSPDDYMYLGVVIHIIGTSDRTLRAAAGRVGFRTFIDSPEDAFLYSKLRQYRWQPEDQALGHNGGHYGGYQPEFLRDRVLPAFFVNAE
jgi:pimeloyl-ACP methyl ester carboxylesterase